MGVNTWDGVPSMPAGHKIVDADTTVITRMLGALLDEVLVFKQSDTSLSSSTTMQNDSDLVLPVAANAMYVCRGMINYAAASGPQIKIGFTVPVSANIRWMSNALDSGVTSNQSGIIDKADRSSSTPTLGVAGAGTNCSCIPELTLTTSATPGNLQFQWAQASSSGTATVLKAGSYLILKRFG